MTEFVELKTAELEGPALDWCVAQASGAERIGVTERKTVCCIYAMSCGSGCFTDCYQPSTDWSQGGLLIEKCRLELIRSENGYSAVRDWIYGEVYQWWPEGETHLIAACRAIVASVLGETVLVPKELCQ